MERPRAIESVLYGGALVIAVAAGAYAFFTKDDRGQAEAPVAARETAQQQNEAPQGDGEPRVVPDLPSVPDLRTEPPPARPSGEADPRIAELGAEMRFVGRARELLAEDHPADALAILEEHRHRHADGVLREEREAFAIEALIRLDRRPEAERRYYDFARAYPQSDFSARLADLMR